MAISWPKINIKINLPFIKSPAPEPVKAPPPPLPTFVYKPPTQTTGKSVSEIYGANTLQNPRSDKLTSSLPDNVPLSEVLKNGIEVEKAKMLEDAEIPEGSLLHDPGVLHVHKQTFMTQLENSGKKKDIQKKMHDPDKKIEFETRQYEDVRHLYLEGLDGLGPEEQDEEKDKD